MTDSYVDLNHLRYSDFSETDVLIGMERLLRFGGLGRVTPLSVLQHSWLVAELIEQAELPASACLLGLLHDAEEVFVGDLTTPTKDLLELTPQQRMRIEQTNLAIHQRFGVSGRFDSLDRIRVKKYDTVALDIERRVLWPEDDNEEAYNVWPRPKMRHSAREAREWYDIARTKGCTDWYEAFIYHKGRL